MSVELQRAGLGETLADAKAGAFFQWFHLIAVDEAAVEEPILSGDGKADALGGERHRFRPSGPRFHHLVNLELAVDGSARIAAACLKIDRAFIANSAIRPFARDLAKSFLQWILPAEAGVALQPDIDAIGRFCDGESVVVVASSEARRSWLKWRFMRRNDLSAVFMERAVRAERQIGQTRIVFENQDHTWLHMSAVRITRH